MKLFAVIPTIGERLETLVPMVDKLMLEGVNVIVVDNGDAEHDVARHIHPLTYIQSHDWDGAPINLSALWNMGLDWAEDLAGEDEFIVAVLNDDLVLPDGLVADLAQGIIDHKAAAAYVNPFAGPARLYTDRDMLTLFNRMVGYAFALDGRKGLRADETLFWWWGDTDLDIRARAIGGVVGLPIRNLGHVDANGYTNRRPELFEQAGRDRETFFQKHGFLPW